MNSVDVKPRVSLSTDSLQYFPVMLCSCSCGFCNTILLELKNTVHTNFFWDRHFLPIWNGSPPFGTHTLYCFFSIHGFWPVMISWRRLRSLDHNCHRFGGEILSMQHIPLICFRQYMGDLPEWVCYLERLTHTHLDENSSASTISWMVIRYFLLPWPIHERSAFHDTV